MVQVNQQWLFQKATVMEIMENAMPVTHLHLIHLEKYGEFGNCVGGKTFLEQIREIDAGMRVVADYFDGGGDAERLPMGRLRLTREYIHRLIPLVGNQDAAYTAALFRIQRNIDMALKCAAATEVAAAIEAKKKRLGRKVEPLSAIINVDNLGEDEHGNKRTAQDLINRLRELINSCAGPTDVSAVLVAAIKQGYLEKFPSENQYKEIRAKDVGTYKVMRRQKSARSVTERLWKQYHIFR